MESIRHIPEVDPYLDAAREAILAVGWRRTTLTDVARLAGVSRMTLYRRFDDMGTLLGDLMTREWARMMADVAIPATSDATAIADEVVAMVGALRANPLFGRILDVDPELLLPYLLDRRGRSQDLVLAALEQRIAAAQPGGGVRSGDPRLLARTVLLTAHGFALSAATMTEADGPDLADLHAELGRVVTATLAP
ncbi:TetR/AcrR family transcriptional regulator [Alteromonas gracilis]